MLMMSYLRRGIQTMTWCHPEIQPQYILSVDGVQDAHHHILSTYKTCGHRYIYTSQGMYTHYGYSMLLMYHTMYHSGYVLP